MFALAIRYLNGWSLAAADGPLKTRPEWPPHPDRVFLALAAAWFETGEPSGEGDALRWLEALPPPSLSASDATFRSAVTSYVPVNDRKGGKTGSRKTEIAKLRDKGLARLSEHRLRQPRGFPVAIPHNPTVRLIWRDVMLDVHRPALDRLVAKVTHVGHSASFVQAWVEDGVGVSPDWEPTEAGGLATQLMRIPAKGRLSDLARAHGGLNRVLYCDLRERIRRAEADRKSMKPPPRVPWHSFPDCLILADEMRMKRHPQYAAAKGGDASAATRLVQDLVDDDVMARARTLVDSCCKTEQSTLVCANAYEREGVNAIPAALARLLVQRIGASLDLNVVQTNVVQHTGADGFSRLARQAAFGGGKIKDGPYVIVDDFVGQGGTLANLLGWIEKQGGSVACAIALAGKPYSARLNPTEEQLDELRRRHGPELERWWRDRFGHTFDCLTQSEARYLARTQDADRIRDRITAAERQGGGSGGGRNPREQAAHVKDLKAELRNRFPDGQPPPPRRPSPGVWQGYRRPTKPVRSMIPQSNFDPHILVFALRGRTMPLVATLQITTAFRGLLMRECPDQPPPEWFSGHQADGQATSLPHLALSPLPFVGSQHSDGRVMGVAMVLPRDLDPHTAGHCLEPILFDSETGLSREHTLFGTRWFECRLELDARERPPTNLNPETWSGGSKGARTWATVTPVAFNRHFDGKDRWERAAESLKDACQHIGLPRPNDVMLHPVSVIEGVPHSRQFPQLPRSGGPGHRRHSHALFYFDEPVCGPVLIGAGRFRGYGLCRPIRED